MNARRIGALLLFAVAIGAVVLGRLYDKSAAVGAASHVDVRRDGVPWRSVTPAEVLALPHAPYMDAAGESVDGPTLGDFLASLGIRRALRVDVAGSKGGDGGRVELD